MVSIFWWLSAAIFIIAGIAEIYAAPSFMPKSQLVVNGISVTAPYQNTSLPTNGTNISKQEAAVLAANKPRFNTYLYAGYVLLAMGAGLMTLNSYKTFRKPAMQLD